MSVSGNQILNRVTSFAERGMKSVATHNYATDQSPRKKRKRVSHARKNQKHYHTREMGDEGSPACGANVEMGHKDEFHLRAIDKHYIQHPRKGFDIQN